MSDEREQAIEALDQLIYTADESSSAQQVAALFDDPEKKAIWPSRAAELEAENEALLAEIGPLRELKARFDQRGKWGDG